MIRALALCLVGCASTERMVQYHKQKEDLKWLELSQLKQKENSDCYDKFPEADGYRKCGPRYVIHDPRLDPVRSYDGPSKQVTVTKATCGYGVCRSTTLLNGAIINSTEIRSIPSPEPKSYRK
jgi:hypothetical protein